MNLILNGSQSTFFSNKCFKRSRSSKTSKQGIWWSIRTVNNKTEPEPGGQVSGWGCVSLLLPPRVVWFAIRWKSGFKAWASHLDNWCIFFKLGWSLQWKRSRNLPLSTWSCQFLLLKRECETWLFFAWDLSHDGYPHIGIWELWSMSVSERMHASEILTTTTWLSKTWTSVYKALSSQNIVKRLALPLSSSMMPVCLDSALSPKNDAVELCLLLLPIALWT